MQTEEKTPLKSKGNLFSRQSYGPFFLEFKKKITTTECFHPNIRNKMRMSALTTSIEHHIGGSSQYNEIHEMISMEIEKKDVKLSLFEEDVKLNIERNAIKNKF